MSKNYKVKKATDDVKILNVQTSLTYETQLTGNSFLQWFLGTNKRTNLPYMHYTVYISVLYGKPARKSSFNAIAFELK